MDSKIANWPCADIVERITDAFFVLDSEGRIAYMNTAAETLLRKNREQLLGNYLWQELPEAVGERFHTEYQQAVTNSTSVVFEEYAPLLDMWVEVHSYPSPDNMIVYIHNITGRKIREEELFAMEQITGVALRALPLDELMNTILERLVRIMRADTAVILLKDDGWLHTRASHGLDEEVAQGFSIEMGMGFARTIAETKQPLYVEDAQTDPLIVNPLIRNSGVHTLIGVPMMHGDELIGVLHVAWLTLHPKSWRDERLLNVAADKCAVAIVNADLVERLRADEERFRAMSESAFEGILVGEDGRIIELNETLTGLLGYDRSELKGTRIEEIISAESWKCIKETGEQGLEQPCEAVVRRKDGSTLIGEIRTKSITYKGQSVRAGVIRDITERKRTDEALQESDARYRALINAGSQVIYRMSPDWSEMRQLQGGSFLPDTEKPNRNWLQEYIYSDDRDRVLEAIHKAIQTESVFEMEHRILRIDGKVGWTFSRAVPVRNSTGEIVEWFGAASDITERKWAEEALASDKQYITAMEGIAELGVSPLERGELLSLLAERVATGLKTHAAHIMMLEEDKHEFVTEAVYNVPAPTGFRIGDNQGFIGRISGERRTIYLSDVANDPVAEKLNLSRIGVKSLLGTPLIVRGRMIGVLYVGALEVRGFSPADINLLEDMASRAALILENTRLHADLIESRREIQDALKTELHFSLLLARALLPSIPPMLDGYLLGSIYIPAFASREIGGDFYDVFRTQSGKIALLIGDVSGKGLEAASFAAASRSTLRAFAYELSSPAEILMRANAVLSHNKEDDTLFVTIFLMIIDPQTGDLLHVAAGHPPAVVHCHEDGTELLAYGNPPLGVFEDWQFAEVTGHLDPGDKVVLFTDGITEARHDGEMFGTEGVERFLKQYGKLTPEVLVDQLAEAASSWAEGHLTDDIAILVVARPTGI